MRLKPLLLTLISGIMAGCTDVMDDIVASGNEMLAEGMVLTRSSEEDSISNGETEPLGLTDDMMFLKEQLETLRSQKRNVPLSSYDDYDYTLSNNMYAIRELPATIQVRAISSSGSTSGYKNLFCEGKGKEVVLNNLNDASKNRFYLKILPASSGIPYLIYSHAAQTPLCVGYYTNNPNDKILMAAKDESSSSYGLGWDLIRSSSYKNYYAIESQSYLGQSDPDNMWSIFNYVLEAVSGNKIRYAQRANNKAQQEFIITPDAKFTLISLEYDIDNATAYATTPVSKTVNVKNTSQNEVAMNIPFDFYELENSFYGKSDWNVNLNFSNSSKLFKRPLVLLGNVITPEYGTPEDANFTSTSTQYINRHLQYSYPIRCKANSIAKVTAKFVKYSVSVKYTAKAQYVTSDGNIRECILKGTWNGTIMEDPNIIAPDVSITYTSIGTGGDIILTDPILKPIVPIDSLITIHN